MSEIKTLQFAEGSSVTVPLPIGSAGGSGSGEVNYVTNNNGLSDLDQTSTDDIGDWLDSGTGITSSISTTSSEIPRYPFQTTAIKLNNDGSSTGYTQIRFEVPPADRNKKLKIEWAQLVGAAYATGDFSLELYNYSDNYATGETAVSLHGSSDIPAQTGVYYNGFDADNRQYYELRIVRVTGGATSTHFIAINDFIVGPGKLHSGAVVTAWQDYTPAGDPGIGLTWSNSWARYRRVGDSIDLDMRFVVVSGSPAGSVDFNDADYLPPGLTYALGQKPASGSWNVTDISAGSTANQAGGVIDMNQSNGSARFVGATLASDIVDDSFPMAWAAGDLFDIHISGLPIEEWEGSGVLNVITQDNLSEWQDYTPTFSAAWGTTSSVNFAWRKVGDSIEIKGSAIAGTTTTGAGTISIPSGLTITGVAGTGRITRGTTAGPNDLVLRTGSNVMIVDDNLSSTGNLNSFIAASEPIAIEATWPIAEWAGSQSSLVGFSQASEDQNGLVKRNKWQRKKLTADVTTTTATVSDLTISNLTVGNTYRVSAQAFIDATGTTATEAFSFTCDHNSSQLMAIGHRNDAQTDASRQLAGNSTIFVASATTVTFGMTLTGTGALRGNNTYEETWAMIEELDNYGAESSDF